MTKRLESIGLGAAHGPTIQSVWPSPLTMDATVGQELVFSLVSGSNHYLCSLVLQLIAYKGLPIPGAHGFFGSSLTSSLGWLH